MVAEINDVKATNVVAAQGFSLSSSAIARIAKLLHDEPPGSYLRIAVLGGGCSGFQYNFTFDNAPLAEDDVSVANAVVDTTSLELMQNAMLDYVEHLGGAAFEIKNPQAVAGCGCGNSFSV